MNEKIICVIASEYSDPQHEEEFLELVKACDMCPTHIITQHVKQISYKTYIGSGKCQEIQDILQDESISYVVFAHALTPLQIKNLQEILQIPILDRNDIILRIFDRHATSKAARLQIKTARLQNELPRLIGSQTQLSRQGGSGFNKGAGEQQLELDRRTIRHQIQEAKKELKKLKAQRMTQRKARTQSLLPVVSLIGYTNAGKSTLMNRILQASGQEKEVLEKDQLFATLDTSIRHIQRGNGHSFLLSDTVGFISDLPHTLIEAFHSTLEEICYADLLIQVIDASSPYTKQQIDVTMQTLKELNAAHIPMLIIFNKCDKTEYTYPLKQDDHLYICANDTLSINMLLEEITKQLFQHDIQVQMQIPYTQYNICSHIMHHAQILLYEEHEEFVILEAFISKRLYQTYQSYVTKIINV